MEEIEVIYNDGMFGFVSPAELTCLIEAEEIVKFMRQDAWVFLGVDPVRTGQSQPVFIEKRRSFSYV
ncbi:MAG: hypothetical protein L3J63_01580 [Geopsychrobacter sp.]|nr:hypothetical protein [Geopsychrobacter sp.]